MTVPPEWYRLITSNSVPNAVPNLVPNSMPNSAFEIRMFFGPIRRRNRSPKYQCSPKKSRISVYFNSVGIVNDLDLIYLIRCRIRCLIRLQSRCQIRCPKFQMFFDRIWSRNRCPKYECSQKQIRISVEFKSVKVVNDLDVICPIRRRMRCLIRFRVRCQMRCPKFKCSLVRFGAENGVRNTKIFRKKFVFRFISKV